MSEENNGVKDKLLNYWRILGKIVTTAVDRVEVAVISISLTALALLLITNVLARTFYRSIYFAEEISQFLIIMVTFVGTSYAARKARHIRMGAIMEAFPPKLEKVFVILMSVISAAVMFILAYYAYQYMEVIRFRQQTTPSLRAPYWTFVLIAPIGLFMAGIQYVRTVIKNLVEKDVWLSPEQQSEFEDEQTMLAHETADDEEDVKL